MNTYKNNTQLPQSSVSVSAFLNGKAKQYFLDYYWKNYIGKTRFLNQKSETDEFFNSLYPTFQNALIIDFFDSSGVFISIIPIIYQNERLNCFHVEINNKFVGQKRIHSRNFNSRTEAILRAVEFANVLYNERVVEAEH